MNTHICVHICVCVGDKLEESATRHLWDFFFSSQIRVLNLKFKKKKNLFRSSCFIECLKPKVKNVSNFPTFSASAFIIIQVSHDNISLSKSKLVYDKVYIYKTTLQWCPAYLHILLTLKYNFKG